MQEISFKKNTVIWGLSFAIERMISFLILPVITKKMGMESYGVWTQIIITSSMLSLLLSLGFNTTLVRFAAGQNNNTISGIFHRVIFIVLIGLAFFSLFIFIFRYRLSIVIFGDVALVEFIYVLCLLVMVETLFELIGVSMLRSMERVLSCSIYNIIRYSIRAGILFIGVFCFSSLWGSVFFIAIAQLFLVVIIYFRHIFFTIGFCFYLPGKIWHKIINFSLPIFLYSIFITIMLHSNRYIILHLLNIEELSIYAVYYSLAGIVSVLYSVLGFTLYPRMSSMWNNDDLTEVSHLFNISLSYYIFFSIPVVTILTMLHGPIVAILSRMDYVADYMLMLYLSLSIVFFGLYQIHFYIMLFRRKMKFNIIIILISLLIMALFSFLLIPYMGVNGAAFSLLLSNIFLAVCTILESKKILTYKFPWFLLSRNLFAALLISSFIYISGNFWDLNIFYNLLLMLIFSAAIYFFFDLMDSKSLLKILTRAL